MADRPTVVTISRQIGSGGAFIGQAVARALGLKYVDREILQRAAAALGVDDEQSIEALEERSRSAWSGIARVIFIGAPDAPFAPPPPPGVHEGDVFEAETHIIREIAAHENAVIVGRGAPHVLKDFENVIRVFVHAPEAMRVAEVSRVYQLSDADARQMVLRSDRNRARFVQSLIGRSWTDACLYDLTVDTSIVPIELAADLITRIVAPRLSTRSGGRT
jgi:CMP/dCMP kinase